MGVGRTPLSLSLCLLPCLKEAGAECLRQRWGSGVGFLFCFVLFCCLDGGGGAFSFLFFFWGGGGCFFFCFLFFSCFSCLLFDGVGFVLLCFVLFLFCLGVFGLVGLELLGGGGVGMGGGVPGGNLFAHMLFFGWLVGYSASQQHANVSDIQEQLHVLPH